MYAKQTYSAAEVQIAELLKKLYHDLDQNIGSEYQELQTAIICVLNKIYQHDHAVAYANKLVMFIEARRVLRNLYFTPEQNSLITALRDCAKETNLDYVYLAPIDSLTQFTK